MKINNKGFSLSTMITLMVVLLLVIVVVSVLAYNNGVAKDSPHPTYGNRATID